MKPRLLLLDEPVNGLDFQSTEYLYQQAGVMWQALSSKDNAVELTAMLMLLFYRREFVFFYVGMLSAYTVLMAAAVCSARKYWYAGGFWAAAIVSAILFMTIEDSRSGDSIIFGNELLVGLLLLVPEESRLRRKIEDAPNVPAKLLTEIGFGYLLWKRAAGFGKIFCGNDGCKKYR